MKLNVLSLLTLSLFGTSAFANTTHYTLTLRNGGNMPISPGVVYVSNGPSTDVQIGQTASKGLVQLCQTGNPSLRAMELKNKMNISSISQTMGMIMPGTSVSVEVQVANVGAEVYFEGMYGKTKDTCAVGHLTSSHVEALTGKDEVLSTGAFTSPGLPLMTNNVCMSAADGVSCLRELSEATNGTIHYFASYLPSVLQFLENRYGSTDTQTLVIPTSGALQLELTLQH
jgi:hypothetical protein